jgi:phage repressor protein C with HTH and peptisase S24 domain
MSDKSQTSSKHQKLSGEKKKQKSGWISRSSGKKKQKDTTIVYTRRPNETYEEYLETLEETPEEVLKETPEGTHDVD